MRIFSAGTRRRLRALGLAAGTLWAVCITAGSDTAAGAMEALGQALPLRALRWELGDLWYQDQLSPAVAVTLGESPLLLAARPAVAELRRQEEFVPQNGGGEGKMLIDWGDNTDFEEETYMELVRYLHSSPRPYHFCGLFYEKERFKKERWILIYEN